MYTRNSAVKARVVSRKCENAHPCVEKRGVMLPYMISAYRRTKHNFILLQGTGAANIGGIGAVGAGGAMGPPNRSLYFGGSYTGSGTEVPVPQPAVGE